MDCDVMCKLVGAILPDSTEITVIPEEASMVLEAMKSVT
jgi:hypothetical protein